MYADEKEYAPRTPAGETRREWFAFLTAPIVWAVYFTLVYLASEFFCYLEFARFELFGIPDVTVVTIIALVPALVGVIAPGVAGFRLWREAPVGDIPEQRRDQDQDRKYFMGAAAMMMSVLFTILTLAVAVAGIYLNPC